MMHGHGSDAYKYNKKIESDFSSNVWYEGTPPELIAHLKTCFADIRHYPEPAAESLSENLATRYELSPEQVIVGNGSVEIFYLIAQAFSACDSLIFAPAFAEYADACRVFSHNISYAEIEKLKRKPNLNADLVWFGNPNNPDGTVFSSREILDLCRTNSEAIFVIDEAYAELCFGFESAIPLLANFDSIIITRSLTKTFAMPGLRLGYALSSSGIIDKLKRLKLPWTVNSLAIEAGNFLLANYERFLPDLKQMFSCSKKLQEEISAINGLLVKASDCNYFLVEMEFGTAEELKNYLIEKHGLLIRNASNFERLTESHFRVAMQTEAENAILVNAIKNFMQKWN